MTDGGDLCREGAGLRARCLKELSQELCRFSYGLARKFRCPACLKDVSIGPDAPPSEGDRITEEHILPRSVGGEHSSFLCKECNSEFGYRQTRWLSEYIDLVQGGAPFPLDPRRQRATLTANGLRLGGNLRLASDGAIEFVSDLKRSNPEDYFVFWQSTDIDEVQTRFSMSLFNNERALSVGYLTAAYGAWFKNFGYSWVLQKCLDVVRQQMLEPHNEVLTWNFLMAEREPTLVPSIGLAKFGDMIFPVAYVYDHIVILPTASAAHPQSTDRVLIRWLELTPSIQPRYQHRCVGPANFTCDGQPIIVPDVFAQTTVPAASIDVKCWS